MKQTRKLHSFGNAHIGPLSEFPETQKQVEDIQASLATNSAIIKDFVRKERQTMLRDFNNKIICIPSYLSKSKYWNNMKKSTLDTSHEIFAVTKEEVLNIEKPIKKFRKKIGKIFSRSSHIKHKDIELLVKLAELKQKGIITTKEYYSKKKQILEKI